MAAAAGPRGIGYVALWAYLLIAFVVLVGGRLQRRDHAALPLDETPSSSRRVRARAPHVRRLTGTSSA